MGAGQSTGYSAGAHYSPSRALHVLRVTPMSPASQSDIEPFFDFVVGFEGDKFSSHHSIDVVELEKIVETHEGRSLNLLVWNSKKRETRVVPVIPSREWSLPHVEEHLESFPQPSLLGLSMRICEPELSLENVWHVLDVLEGSPAESAGLVPYGDWIVGWSGGVLNAENDFYDLVEAHVDKPLRVYVYSYDFDNLREVLLIPNRQWGGEGLLGCVFGFGLLHRIPSIEHQPGDAPPDPREENADYEEQGLFVPADVYASQEGPTPYGQDDRKAASEATHEAMHTSHGSHLHENESDHTTELGSQNDRHPYEAPSHNGIPELSRTSPLVNPSPLARSILNGNSTRALGFLAHPEGIISRSQTPTTPSHRLILNQTDGDGVGEIEMESSTGSLTSVD